MLNPGRYRAVPTAAVLGETSTGKEQIVVDLELLDPPGERRVWYGFFTDAAFETTIRALRACGWTGTHLEEFQYGAPTPAGFGAEVEIVIEHEADQNGAPRERVRWINSGGGLGCKTPLDAAKAAQFAERMRARIVSYDLKNPRGAGAAAPTRRPAPAAEREPSYLDDAPPVDDNEFGF